MIDSSFVSAIVGNAATGVLEVNGRQFTTKQVFNAPHPDEPACVALEVGSLSPIGDYVKAINRDKLKPEELFLHIVSPTCVQLISAIQGVHRTREIYLTSQIEYPFQYGHYYPHGDALIHLQTAFSNYGDQPKLLHVLGTLKDESVRISKDDGASISVIASAGVVMAQEMQLPRPAMLAPFRTFREVPQVPGPFLVRLQPTGKPGGMPTIAIFEMDSGLWQAEAVRNIREYLTEKIGASGVVIVG